MSHVPNEVSGGERFWRLLTGVFLIVYGGIGLYLNDIFIPTKHGRAIHLHGPAAWVMAAAMVCGAAVSLASVIDHYDRRDNEHAYRLFGRGFAALGWVLVVLSFAISAGGISWPSGTALPAVNVSGGVMLAMGIVLGAAVFRNKSTTSIWFRPAARKTTPVPRRGAARGFARVVGLLAGIVGVLALGIAVTSYFARYAHIAAKAGIVGILALMVAHVLLEYAREGNWSPLDTPAARNVSIVLTVALAALFAYSAFGPPASPNWNQARWREKDEAVRQSAPGWGYGIDEMKTGTAIALVHESLKTAGFDPNCYGNLRPGERMRQTDTQVCFVIIRSAWSIPAYMALMTFNTAGLDTWKIDFDGRHWPAIESFLDGAANRMRGDFGRDSASNPLQMWWTEDSVIIAAPTRSPSHWGTVLRHDRRKLVAELCSGAGSADLTARTVATYWADLGCSGAR